MSRLVERLCILVIVSILAFFGWSAFLATPRKTDDTVVWKDVRRVFMHQSYEYSIMVPKDGSGELNTIKVYGPAKIFSNTPDGSPMWAQARMKKDGSFYSLEVHIHSAQEINGGGWEKRQNKQIVKGMTEVVE